jgi:hypothetical protein
MMDSVASHGASNDAVVKGLYDVVMQEPFFNLTIVLPIPDGLTIKVCNT